jgi:hypothetical protein
MMQSQQRISEHSLAYQLFENGIPQGVVQSKFLKGIVNKKQKSPITWMDRVSAFLDGENDKSDLMSADLNAMAREELQGKTASKSVAPTLEREDSDAYLSQHGSDYSLSGSDRNDSKRDSFPHVMETDEEAILHLVV